MIIKHGRHIFGEIHEVRKGLWAFLSWMCFSDSDWLGRQIPITWKIADTHREKGGPLWSCTVFLILVSKDIRQCSQILEYKRDTWRHWINLCACLLVGCCSLLGTAIFLCAIQVYNNTRGNFQGTTYSFNLRVASLSRQDGVQAPVVCLFVCRIPAKFLMTIQDWRVKCDAWSRSWMMSKNGWTRRTRRLNTMLQNMLPL